MCFTATCTSVFFHLEWNLQRGTHGCVHWMVLTDWQTELALSLLSSLYRMTWSLRCSSSKSRKLTLWKFNTLHVKRGSVLLVGIARACKNILSGSPFRKLYKKNAIFFSTLFVTDFTMRESPGCRRRMRVALTRIRWRYRPALSHLSARTLTESFDQWRILFRRLSSFIGLL